MMRNKNVFNLERGKKMKNQKIILNILLVFVVISFTGVSSAQSLQKTKSLVQEEVGINWIESRFGCTEYQSVEFKEDKMVVTRKSVYKDKSEIIQTAVIPLARIDVSRLQSYEAAKPEGMYFLSIFTIKNEKVINITTIYGKDTDDNIFDTNYYTLFSKNRDKSQALKEKIEYLVYLLDKGN
jgi:hypothetical protein